MGCQLHQERQYSGSKKTDQAPFVNSARLDEFTHQQYTTWTSSKTNKNLTTVAQANNAAFRGILNDALAYRRGLGSGVIGLMIDVPWHQAEASTAFTLYESFIRMVNGMQRSGCLRRMA